jgi:hypothetical protein
MRKENMGYHCWVTNRTNHRVSVGDLNFTLKPHQTLDILDYRHSSLSVEMVEKSLNDGDLMARKKEQKIYFNQEKPQSKKVKIIDPEIVAFPSRCRTSITVAEKKYEELEQTSIMDDYEFAEQNADMAVSEHSPQSNKTETEE